MEENQLGEEQNLVKQVNITGSSSFLKDVVIPSFVILAVIIAGSLTGYRLAGSTVKEKEVLETGGSLPTVGSTQAPSDVGIKDEKRFPDQVEGRIEVNDNPDVPEGSHRLIRPGGPSQTAYLTSSVVDLNIFIGKCVHIWGQTFSSQKSGWYLDVGRLKVLDQCPEGV